VGNEPFAAATGWLDEFTERHALSPFIAGTTIKLSLTSADLEKARRNLAIAVEEMVAEQSAWFEAERTALTRRQELSEQVFERSNASSSRANFSEIPTLFERSARLERMLNAPYTRPVETVEALQVIRSTNNTRLNLILPFTLLLGVFLGAFGALLAEFLSIAHKARKAELPEGDR
jgi:hypothetical protein